MSKGLEELNKLINEDYVNDNLHLNRHCCYVIIEKELKALEIIKKYPKVPIQRLIIYETNKTKGYDVGTLEDNDIPYAKEEYKLLKEVLL